MALQMTCPYCKREFPYDNGKLDAEISAIGQRITSINKRLTEIKYAKHTGESWYERKLLVKELTALTERIAGLKAIRKVADQQINFYSLQILKDIIKDRYGEADYMSILRQMSEELKAYKESGLMWHEYTKKASKPAVISVTKL